MKHFAKEFTKKTKTALDLPCSESAPAGDKRAEAKLRLAVEHTKRSLSASTGAATCAVESLKDGLDLSTSITRLRFDALAAPVYRQIGAALEKVVVDAGFDLAQIDEVLLAGASTLFPGLQNSLQQLVQETTPVSAAIDPSQVIAIGCALQALHLSQIPAELVLPEVLAIASDREVPTLSATIGLAAPGSDATAVVKLVEAGAPLPTRRRVQLSVASGASAVAVELHEVKESVKITKIPPPPKDEDEEVYSDDEPEEDEEEKEVVLTKAKCLGAVQVDTNGKDKAELEVIVQKDGKVEVRFWVEGAEDKASRLDL